MEAYGAFSAAAESAGTYDFIGNPAAQDALFAQAPQMSGAAGRDSYDLCGGCTLAAALVADSTTLEAAQQNAAAIRSLASASHTRLSPDDTRALEHFASGHLTVPDMMQLQGMMYRIGVAAAGPGGGGGISSGLMTGMVESLRERGGLAQSSPVFTQLSETVSGTTDTTNHWVVTTGGRTVDSWPNDGTNDHGTVTPGAPPTVSGHPPTTAWTNPGSKSGRAISSRIGGAARSAGWRWARPPFLRPTGVRTAERTTASGTPGVYGSVVAFRDASHASIDVPRATRALFAVTLESGWWERGAP